MKKQDVMDSIRQRISDVLEWYKGCTASDETLRNVQRDLDSLWRHIRKDLPQYKLDGYRIRASYEGDCVVGTVEPFDSDCS